MKVLSIRGNGFEPVAALSDADLNNIELLKKLKTLEEEYKALGAKVDPRGMFEIIEVADIGILNANSILEKGFALADCLETYIMLFKAEINQYKATAKKEGRTLPGEVPKRKDLAYYQWDIKEETDAMRESGYYD